MDVKLLKSKLFKDTALYSIINIADKAIPFLIMPIISRVLTKEEMGYYSLFQVSFAILLPILTLSIDFAINIKYFKLDKNQFSLYQSTGIYLTLFIYTCLFLLSVPFHDLLSTIFGLDGYWLFAVYLISILHFFNQMRMNLWQAETKPISYGSFALPFALVKYLIALVLILYFRTGWTGIILGYLAGEVIFSIIAIISFVRNRFLSLRFNAGYIREILKTSIPITIHKISSWFSTSINRLIINSILGAAATGSFGIGSTFGTIVTVMEDAVNKAYWPYLYKKLSVFNGDTSKQLVKLIYVYYLFFIVMGVVIGIIGYYGVGLIFGDLYADTKVFIMPLVLSSIINGVYKLHVNIIFFSGKTYIVARNTIVCAIVNVVSSYIMVYYLGLKGAAYSAIIVQLVLYLLTLIYSNKLYALPWMYLFKK